jgi:4-amino-4-deoxy-L-arabinose transferase-like glycosyltransferase
VNQQSLYTGSQASLPELPQWTRFENRATLTVAGIVLATLFALAFIHHEIYVDEAWLGQQVYTLIGSGQVSSPFFQDMYPLDGTIVVYHKLLIWSAAAVCYVAGWGLYSLRLVSLLCGLGLLALVYRRVRQDSPNQALLATALLCLTPLYFRFMIVFRPEMLVALCGFASYLLLESSLRGKRAWMIPAAGLLAGLSGTAHAAGLAFVCAGIVTLAFERRVAGLFLFLLCAVIGFYPYVSGYFTDKALFLDQLFHNKLFAADLNNSWWRAPLNILEEHKRWFRKPEVIGLSVLFLLSLVQIRKEEFRRRRVFWSYFITLVVVIAAAPIPKITRYLLSLAPFMAMFIALRITDFSPDISSLRTIARRVSIAWLALFTVVGIWSLVDEAFLHPNDQIEVNNLIATQMQTGSTVMAPFDFIFEEQPNFNIMSYRGAWIASGDNRTPEALDTYANSHHVRYLVLSPEEIGDWGLDSTNVARSMTHFAPAACAPQSRRWLLQRIPY